MTRLENIDPINDLDIAVIGMSGRFPGARNLREFWLNLRDGVESISFFSDQEMEFNAVDPATLRDPHYVKAAAVLEGVELFDAAFFGYSPREAEIMDPQSRLFLECAWETLENAGCHIQVPNIRFYRTDSAEVGLVGTGAKRLGQPGNFNRITLGCASPMGFYIRNRFGVYSRICNGFCDNLGLTIHSGSRVANFHGAVIIDSCTFNNRMNVVSVC